MQEKETRDKHAKCQPAPELMKALVINIIKLGPLKIQPDHPQHAITFEHYMSCMRLIGDTAFQHMFGLQQQNKATRRQILKDVTPENKNTKMEEYMWLVLSQLNMDHLVLNIIKANCFQTLRVGKP